MKHFFDKIPEEMKSYKQFVCWRYEEREKGKKPTKVPYNPRMGEKASVTDSSTWCSYDEAVRAVEAIIGYDGIGFVLTKDDPYAIIDLDDTHGNETDAARQQKVLESFNSYTEISPSGTGKHIIIRGAIQQGRRRNAVELYSDERYMTMTGNICHEMPIIAHEGLLQMLWEQMGAPTRKFQQNIETPQKYRDEEIIQQGISAKNGEKFKELLEGRWEGFYSSQSEADLAFINMLGFYTQNREQIRNIFRNSPLGARAKANRNNYVEPMIDLAFDQHVPLVNIEGLRDDYNAHMENKAKGAGNENLSQPLHALKDVSGIQLPPGLLGELAKFFYASSARPVKEIALVGAIGFLAGICGRAYNISGGGLNQYFLLLASTGTGKEAMTEGMDKLAASLKDKIPTIVHYRGPSRIASGQALVKHLANKSRCFVSVIGEFGLTMQRLAHPKPSQADLALKDLLLDLYNKSGKDRTVQPMIYADQKNNTEIIENPAFSLLCESTHETFFNVLDEGLIADGLLPRFNIIEYNGDRQFLNENHSQVQLSESLQVGLIEFFQRVMELEKNNTVHQVERDGEAARFLRELDVRITKQMNQSKKETIKQLWNRVHQKTLRLAAMVAVGVNPVKPVITLAIAEWSYDIVRRSVEGITARFENGDVGRCDSESKQMNELIRVAAYFLTMPYDELGSYDITQKIHDDKVLPYSYLQSRLVTNRAFTTDRIGATKAIKRTIDVLVAEGVLYEIPRKELVERYDSGGKAYAPLNFARLIW